MNTVTDKAVRETILDNSALDAYTEALYRRRIASRPTLAMNENGVSYQQVVAALGVSKSQVERLFNKRRGGDLTLLTLIKAACVLRLRVEDLFIPPTFSQVRLV
jgi:transcriptional regulator with XRE-family HTH domain